MAYSLGSISFNDTDNIIREESVKKAANLTTFPLPFSDSDETEVFDFGGVTKTITISVTLIKSTVAEIRTYVTGTLHPLANGMQDTINYVSDLLGTIKVKVLDIDFTWLEADPNRLVYTIRLVESA